MKLPISYYGDSILRQKTKLVTEINDEIRTLIDDMTDTMVAVHGIGLAAPQVNQSIAICLVHPPQPSEEEPRPPIQIFINPKLSNPSGEMYVLSEACLSIPGLHGDVVRPGSITVTYMNIEGQEVTEVVSGWVARILMHENDHLNGVLFIDRMDPKPRKELEPHLVQLKKRIALWRKDPKKYPMPKDEEPSEM